MPVTPYAKILVSVAGGGNTSGAVSATATQSIQLSPESTVGWTSPSARWEIVSFPSGFAQPGSWSTDGVTGAYYYLGTSPPAFTMPAASGWGKFMLRLTVNGGLLNGAAASQLVDTSTIITMASASGLKDLGYGETSQVSASKKWVADHQANLRIIDTSLAAATPLATPNTIASRDGLANSAFATVNASTFASGAASTFAITAAAGITSVALGQADVSTNGATGAGLSIRAQNATGAGGNGGALTLGTGLGSATLGNLVLQCGGTTIGSYALTAGLTDFRFTLGASMPYMVYAANGTNQFIDFQAVGSGGSVKFDTPSLIFRDATATEAARISPLSTGASSMLFAVGVTSVAFSQTDVTTNGSTGASWSIRAQNATGAGGVGGVLSLSGGTGSSTAGGVALQTAGTTKLSTDNNGTLFASQWRHTRNVATYGTTTTFDFNLGGIQQVTLTGGNITTLTLSNMLNGGEYTLVFIQDGTGGRTLAIPATLKLAGGAFTLSAGINKRDVLKVYSDGTNIYETSRAQNI